MHMRLVILHLQPQHLETFEALSRSAAEQTAREAGVISYAILQQADDPTRFTVVEAYQDAAAHAAHLASAHFLAWRAASLPLMAEPPVSLEYAPLFPPEDQWLCGTTEARR
jgi:autoinducer 2-degrading protein